MSEVKNKKKKSSIIQVSIGVLAVILAILIIIMMGIVSDIQGTARIVNYTGLVRGETQRLIKLELSTQQENEMIHDIRTFIDGLRNGRTFLFTMTIWLYICKSLGASKEGRRLLNMSAVNMGMIVWFRSLLLVRWQPVV